MHLLEFRSCFLDSRDEIFEWQSLFLQKESSHRSVLKTAMARANAKHVSGSFLKHVPGKASERRVLF